MTRLHSRFNSTHQVPASVKVLVKAAAIALCVCMIAGAAAQAATMRTVISGTVYQGICNNTLGDLTCFGAEGAALPGAPMTLTYDWQEGIAEAYGHEPADHVFYSLSNSAEYPDRVAGSVEVAGHFFDLTPTLQWFSQTREIGHNAYLEFTSQGRLPDGRTWMIDISGLSGPDYDGGPVDLPLALNIPFILSHGLIGGNIYLQEAEGYPGIGIVFSVDQIAQTEVPVPAALHFT